MFELSFWEIALILLVALIVVGPERLPGLARTAGLWMGKARRFVASVRADIDRELKTEELRRLVDKQAQDMAQLREMLDETKSVMNPQQLIPSTGLASMSAPPAVAGTRPSPVPSAGEPEPATVNPDVTAAAVSATASPAPQPASDGESR